MKLLSKFLCLFLTFELGASFILDYESYEVQDHIWCPVTKRHKEEILLLKCPDPTNDIITTSAKLGVVNHFGKKFTSLKKELDYLSISLERLSNNMSTIYFVGDTGSGKTTLVHLLGSDNNKLFSIPVDEDETDFIIVDHSKIGIDTITSSTQYPDLIYDNSTGYILCDNPGFGDTRGPVNEIVASYGMRKVIQYTTRMKIVIVLPYSSVEISGYRDKFIDVLKNVINLFHDIEKISKTVYLVATKTENKSRTKKGKQIFYSDDSLTNGIGNFFEHVKSSLNNAISGNNSDTHSKDSFMKYVKIIDSLLTRHNGINLDRVTIVRKPMEDGKISDNEFIQNNINHIRKLLRKNDDFVKFSFEDVGFALSDNAKLYLNDVFGDMNKYIELNSKMLSKNIIDHYTNTIKSSSDLDYIDNFSAKFKNDVRQLSIEIGSCKNPDEYAEALKKFPHEFSSDCLPMFYRISTLSNNLENLQILLDNTKYTPFAWNVSFSRVIDHIDDTHKEYSKLKNIFDKLSSYNVQRQRKQFLDMSTENNNVTIHNKNKINAFLRENNYDSIESLTNNDKLNGVLDYTLGHQTTNYCEDNVLTIIDNFILLSELDDDLFCNICTELKKVVILSHHTIYIDKNLTSNCLKGKHLTIISPVWEIIGDRQINLDGRVIYEKLPKADFGRIGMNGKNGNSGGNFDGVGFSFINGDHLLISSVGSDGQNGQDGGDGKEGSTGLSGTDENLTYDDYTGIVLVLYNRKDSIYRSRGYPGAKGSNSGEGGKGGQGGKRGTVKIYNLGKRDPGFTAILEDGVQGENGETGTPGKGGKKGCDKKLVEKTHFFLFIPLYDSKEIEYVNCGLPSEAGEINYRENYFFLPTTELRYNSESRSVCTEIFNFQESYFSKLYSNVSDNITEMFVDSIVR